MFWLILLGALAFTSLTNGDIEIKSGGEFFGLIALVLCGTLILMGISTAVAHKVVPRDKVIDYKRELEHVYNNEDYLFHDGWGDYEYRYKNKWGEIGASNLNIIEKDTDNPVVMRIAEVASNKAHLIFSFPVNRHRDMAIIPDGTIGAK